MTEIGIAVFQRGLDSAQQFVSLVHELENSSRVTHVFLTEAATEAMTALAAASSVTNRVVLGTAIANIYMRHPYTLAASAANVASIAGRKTILGLGTGHQKINVAGFGYDMSDALRHMRDYVSVLRAFLSSEVKPDDVVTGSTKYYQANQLRMGWVGKDVSIAIGALGEKMIRLAGEIGDGIILSVSPRERVRRVADLLALGAQSSERAVKDIEIAAIVNVVIRPTREEARCLLRKTIEGYLRLPYYAQALAPYGFYPGEPVSDRQVDSIGIAGPIDYALEWLADYRKAGVHLPILAPAGVFSLPPYERDVTRCYRDLALLADLAATY